MSPTFWDAAGVAAFVSLAVTGLVWFLSRAKPQWVLYSHPPQPPTEEGDPGKPDDTLGFIVNGGDGPAHQVRLEREGCKVLLVEFAPKASGGIILRNTHTIGIVKPGDMVKVRATEITPDAKIIVCWKQPPVWLSRVHRKVIRPADFRPFPTEPQ